MFATGFQIVSTVHHIVTFETKLISVQTVFTHQLRVRVNHVTVSVDGRTEIDDRLIGGVRSAEKRRDKRVEIGEGIGKKELTRDKS